MPVAEAAHENGWRKYRAVFNGRPEDGGPTSCEGIWKCLHLLKRVDGLLSPNDEKWPFLPEEN